MNGFQNEANIVDYINNNKFSSLNENLKRELLKINNSRIPKIINAKSYAGQNKADLSILLDKKEYFISVKKGTGNSVHQEALESFIVFLMENFENNSSVFNDLRHFIWGDLTLDGTGKVKDRMSANQYKNQFPEKISNIQNYFDKHKNELAKRFIITGVNSCVQADYLLYGTYEDCVIVKEDKLFNYIVSIIKKPISIGVLTFQAWNRNLNGGDLSEKKRGHIQLKWGGLKNDITKI